MTTPGAPDGAPFHPPDGGYPLRTLDQEMVKQALDKSHGNQTHAARLLPQDRRLCP